MSLVNMKRMLRAARDEGYAVGAFNIIDYNSLRAVVEGAEELQAPVIVQTSVKTVEFWGAATIVDWVRHLGGTSPTQMALHLDHCKSSDFVKQCLQAGWTSVMIDASARPFTENFETTREVLAAAQPVGASVEAELGEIAGVEDDLAVDEAGAHLADPDKAEEFCRELALDAFAPAIGTAHGLYKGEPRLAFDRLKEIAQRTDVPLALHGGTGLSPEVFHKCIALGCAKINISTALKHSFIDGFVEPHVKEPKYDPLKLLAEQLRRTKAVVTENILLFGSAGRTGR